MKRTFAFANATIASLVLLLVQCSGESSKNDDENEGGGAGDSTSAGKGGSAGSGAGSAGKGGSAGSAGKGGSAGSSGSGAGTAGKGGTSAGSAGAGGTTGEAGSNGTSAGEGGAAGFDGTAGASGDGGGGSSGDGSGGTSGDGSGGASIDAGGSGGSDNAGGAGSGGEGGVPIEVTPGDTCASAVPLTVGSYDGETTEGLNDDYSYAGCFPQESAGPDRVYQLQIPPGNRLDVDVDPTGSLDLGLVLVAAPASNCVREPECLTLRDIGLDGASESLTFANDSTADRDVFLMVDGFDTQPFGGSYDLDVAMTPAPAGDICVNPLPLGEGTEIAGTLEGDGIGHDYHADPCFEDAYLTIGPDVSYQLDVPAGNTLTVTIDPSDELDPAIYLLTPQGATCDRNSCLGVADTGYQGDDETLVYTNEGASTQTLYLIVDSFAPAFSTPGPFHLDVDITP